MISVRFNGRSYGLYAVLQKQKQRLFRSFCHASTMYVRGSTNDSWLQSPSQVRAQTVHPREPLVADVTIPKRQCL